MKPILSIALTLTIVMVGARAQAQFYYGTNGPIALETDSSKVMVRCDPTLNQAQQTALLQSIDRIAEVTLEPQAIDEFVVCSLSTGQGYATFVDSLESLNGISFAEPFYRVESGTPLYIGRSICVAFDTSLSAADIESVNNLYGVTAHRELEGMPGIYVLYNTEGSDYGTLELANLYHELPETRYAHPGFGLRPRRNAYSLYDYYHEHQWHTKKVIGQFNQASVWDFVGLDRSVTVAVIDDGVTYHEDLPASRLLPGRDFAGDSLNAPSDDDSTPGPTHAHGMGCAGIIGASHTTDPGAGQLSSSGVISLDPHTLIMPVKIFTDDIDGWGTDQYRVAEAITYAWTHGAEVLSCSWGYGDPSIDIPVVTEAIERAAYFGRDGLGCVVAFSSGNDYDYYGYVGYPANLDAVLAVGATQEDDTRWGYTQCGYALDLVAPSGNVCLQGDIWTLDQTGQLGYNPNVSSSCGEPVTWDCYAAKDDLNDKDYDCKFGGTSGACPVVSGTAALLLARDSTLTSSAIYYILRNSAVTDLDWGSIYPPHGEYGYGRVDAFRAILSISRQGDCNNNGAGPNVSDLVYLGTYMFHDGPPIFPSELLADVNCTGTVDITDLTYLVDWCFSGGPDPVSPCFDFGD